MPIKQFSIDQSFAYQAMLDEAIETILEAQAELGSLESLPQRAAAEVAPLRKLKEAQAFFAPTLTVQPLGQKEYAARGLTPGDDIKNWLKTHRFYLVQAPVTLFPVSGWQFARLECWVGFDNPSVKIHAICPPNAWVNVVNTEMSVTLGLDETLSFVAHFGLSPTQVSAENLTASGSADVGVGTEASGRLKFVFGPYAYQIWRPKRLAVGRENAEAFWHLDGGEQVQKQEPYLALVLRVPKTVDLLSASGELVAYHDYNRLGADRKDWWKDLRPKVQAFLRGGIPYQNQASWDNILAGAA